MIKNEATAWVGLRELYRLIGSEDGNLVIRILLQKESVRTSDLIADTKILPARFHNLMKALVLSGVVDKKVHQDRSVWYNISTFGKNVLDLSEPLVEKINEKFKQKDSLLLALIQQRN